MSKFLKITRVIHLKNHPNQTCDYWLITPDQDTLCIDSTSNHMFKREIWDKFTEFTFLEF